MRVSIVILSLLSLGLGALSKPHWAEETCIGHGEKCRQNIKCCPGFECDDIVTNTCINKDEDEFEYSSPYGEWKPNPPKQADPNNCRAKGQTCDTTELLCCPGTSCNIMTNRKCA